MISTSFQQGIGGTGFHSNSLPLAIATDDESNNNNHNNNNNNNNNDNKSGGAGGMKRLASCREELERSWQLSNSSSSSNSISNDNTNTNNNMMMMQDSSSSSNNNNNNNNNNNTLRHCISNDNDMGMTSASDDEDNTDYGTRVVKRRRTIHATNFTNGLSNDMTMMEDHHCGMVPGTTRAIRISPATRPRQTEVPIKAGWYDGEVDGNGARHGQGITRNDDGTEYEGPYDKDIMEGSDGRYKFVTTRHLVPNPQQNGSHLHRQVEKSFVGNFDQDVPNGQGMSITKTIDCAPQVLGSEPMDIRYMEVVYDVGMYNGPMGEAVGEGVRIIYSTMNADGRSTLELTCYRLIAGNNTNFKVDVPYARWMLQCMNVEFPCPTTPADSMM